MSQTIGSKIYTLDSLAELNSDELDSLYRKGTVPDDFRSVHGKPKGRMLTVRPTDGTPVFHALKQISAHGAFPWDGKSFSYSGKQTGQGINRVKLLFSNFDWFPFEIRVEPSVIDDKPCIFLDYEQPENPWFIAKIHDEIREVSPGIYMGPAMWKEDKASPILVLWFALDFNNQTA